MTTPMTRSARHAKPSPSPRTPSWRSRHPRLSRALDWWDSRGWFDPDRWAYFAVPVVLTLGLVGWLAWGWFAFFRHWS